ncbi:MAG TPA: hypothetical protein VJY35_05095 [Candidatus Eisenbacteria bacterium]|nr:hypothetical protein [Candidatus Eisenbacteria bacterium]
MGDSGCAADLILVVLRWPPAVARREALAARLNESGARALGRGVFLLPDDRDASAIEDLAREIVRAGGDALLGRGTLLAGCDRGHP